MRSLTGRRVLLVEDESLVALQIEDALQELGCEVLLAMRLGEALDLAGTAAIDFAVLDVNLGPERSYPVADSLRQRNIPFLFVTGYGVRGLEPMYQNAMVLQKPYRPEDLVRVAGTLLASP